MREIMSIHLPVIVHVSVDSDDYDLCGRDCDFCDDESQAHARCILFEVRLEEAMDYEDGYLRCKDCKNAQKLVK